jgi:hypothetical protein
VHDFYDFLAKRGSHSTLGWHNLPSEDEDERGQDICSLNHIFRNFVCFSRVHGIKIIMRKATKAKAGFINISKISIFFATKHSAFEYESC